MGVTHWLTRPLRALRSAFMEGGPSDSLNTRWSMINQLQARDPQDSWRWFLDRYQPFVRGILVGMTRSRQRGEQAADEFWGYFFKHTIHKKADRERRFRAFLAGVVRRYGLDWMRSDHVPQDAHPDAAIPEPGFTDTLSEDEEMRVYACTVIHNALTRLETGADLQGKLPKGGDAGLQETAQIVRLFYGPPGKPGEEGGERLSASEAGTRLGGKKANAISQR